MWQVDCEKIGEKRTVKGICRNGTLESESANEMKEAIEDGCDQVDSDAWLVFAGC